MRLFASIRPPEEVREHLVTALRPIRDDHGPLLRWPDPDQWHVTVAFYGERPDGSVDELAEHVAAAVATTGFPARGMGSPSLDLHLRGAGSFSGRTLWIGVGGDVGPLRQLMSGCAHDPFAIGDDEDGFGNGEDGGRGGRGGTPDGRRERRRAHLTVARLRAREQGGRRDGRRNHRRSAWAGDRRRGGAHGGGEVMASPAAARASAQTATAGTSRDRRAMTVRRCFTTSSTPSASTPARPGRRRRSSWSAHASARAVRAGRSMRRSRPSPSPPATDPAPRVAAPTRRLSHASPYAPLAPFPYSPSFQNGSWISRSVATDLLNCPAS